MTIRKKKIPAPLGNEELKKKLDNIISNGGSIITDKRAVGLMSAPKPDKNKAPVFEYVEVSGIFSYADEIGVDTKGNEHKTPGGVGVSFKWGVKGFGFGEFSIRQLTNGTIEIDTEGIGKEFFNYALLHLMKHAKDRSQRVQ